MINTLQLMATIALIGSQERAIYNYTCLPTIKLKRGRAVKARDSKKNPKIGRNHLCSCGSGLKFKKCCNSIKVK